MTAMYWEQLTRMPAKAAAYLDEIYFRECWHDLSDVLGRRPELLHATVPILFKPDAVVGRRVHLCLDFLVEHGLKPIAVHELHVTRHMTREIWRQQGNAATLDRFRLIDEMMSATPSLLVLFRRQWADARVPATVFLRTLKGNGFRDRKPPNGLRQVACSPLPLLSLVHAPDEPIDMVRELGILLDSGARRRIFSQVAADWTSDASELVRTSAERMYAAHAAVDLDADAAQARALAALRRGAERTPRIERLVEDIESGAAGSFTWPELDQTFDDLEVRLSKWDFIMVASIVLKMNRSGVEPHIAADGADAWDPPV